MKLTLDQQEDLKYVMTHDGWKALMLLMEDALKRQQDAVLTYNLQDGPEKLVIAKARAEGAANFMKAVINYRNSTVREK